ncbi:hypothetical protein BafHLJ01_0212 [Borreliella afzelii HLJ01]|nr:hypothetical protein BafHLJ01_0212 [Borreliella afzelii HLJ01]
MYISGVNIKINGFKKNEVDKAMISLFRIAICFGSISAKIRTIIVIKPVDIARALFPYFSSTNFVVSVLATIFDILLPIRIVVINFEGD